MTFITEQSRQIPVVAEPGVLVVGGGPAGIGAAVAAARNGARVLLVERYGFPGGNLTVAMVNPMFTFHDAQGRQVIRGIAGEVVERLIKVAASAGHVRDLTFDNASMTPFDPEGMKLVLFDMLEEAGVEMLLHTWAVDAIADGRRVDSVILENKSGRQAVRGKLVIDCSADADIAARVGAPFVKGRESDGAMQPATLFFRIAGVNVRGLKTWMKRNRDLLKDAPTDEEIDSSRALAFLGLRDLIQQAIARGEFPADAAPRILMYQLPREGQFAVNTTRLQGIDGTNARDLTRAEALTRRQAWRIHEFLRKYVGGFESSYLLDTGVQVGIRETRHIVGDYVLNDNDVLEGRSFPDGIATGTFAIDIHPPEGKEQIYTGSGKAVYEIPYRCLLPQGFDNLLVAGRSISATHAASGSARVMATCMAIGQGAGVAAALAVGHGVTTRDVDVGCLRGLLIEQGQYLHHPGMEQRVDANLALQRAGGAGTVAAHYNPFHHRTPE
jgi:hypothetical protein